ncbi:7763_t:CDS:2 [Scutellospora calospora]|uniref:7763_t:CDS:1 n=1 Tax=Scutellospora calospora TaxID=85575 RepID=A0ACA9K1L4_9GLOM|nr:7763_t:CDS:2 [Scutellospora calospora]
MTPIQDKINKKYRNKYKKWCLISIQGIFHLTFNTNELTSSEKRFFETVSNITKDTIIGKVMFESIIQYKEISTDQVDSIDNNQYEFFGDRNVEFEDDFIRDQASKREVVVNNMASFLRDLNNVTSFVKD